MRVQNLVIAVLQVYFLLMNATVEREYCRGPLDPASRTPFVGRAVAFGAAHNPLFVERPDWLVAATCAHASVYWILYAVVLWLAVSDGWDRCPRPLARVVLPALLGGKVYAILFYHYMEFSSHAPPPNLVPYWAAEGPYLLNIGLILHKLVSMATEEERRGKQE